MAIVYLQIAFLVPSIASLCFGIAVAVGSPFSPRFSEGLGWRWMGLAFLFTASLILVVMLVPQHGLVTLSIIHLPWVRWMVGSVALVILMVAAHGEWDLAYTLAVFSLIHLSVTPALSIIKA